MSCFVRECDQTITGIVMRLLHFFKNSKSSDLQLRISNPQLRVIFNICLQCLLKLQSGRQGFWKRRKIDNVQCLGGSPGHHFSKNLVCEV